MLAYGLLRLESRRKPSAKRAIAGLRRFPREGRSKLLRERLLALSPHVRVEIFEVTKPDAEMRRIDISDRGNLESWVVPRRDVESLLRQADQALGQI